MGFESAKHLFVNEDIGVVVKASKPANKFVFNQAFGICAVFFSSMYNFLEIHASSLTGVRERCLSSSRTIIRTSHFTALVTWARLHRTR